MKKFISVFMAALLAMTNIASAEYVRNDPINSTDPSGKCGNDACFDRIAQGYMSLAKTDPAAFRAIGQGAGIATGGLAIATVGFVAVPAIAAFAPELTAATDIAAGFTPGMETYAGAGAGVALFRAVGSGELADITATGVFRNLGSAEGKYFSTTEHGARQYGTMAEKHLVMAHIVL